MARCRASRLRPAAGFSGVLSFYERNSGTQNKVCDLDATTQVVRFPSSRACDDDETRSLVLTFVKAGTTILVYDDPDCETGDDWAEISVKRDLFRTTVNSYETSYENDDVIVSYHADNRLDGKLSCVRIVAP
jgi:hypothetical protein